jgi:LacI family transcriptional regulator
MRDVTADEGRRVTIDTIAREADVSVPTVSRVLSGRSGVPPEVRERVRELLTRYGYVSQAGRRRLTAGLIDLVFTELFDPGALQIIRGVEEAAHESGVGTVVSAIHRSTAVRQWLLNLRTRATDGVILVAADPAAPLHSEVRRLSVPVVLVEPASIPPVDAPTVGATNRAGAREATEHLLSLGHERIGFVTGPLSTRCNRERLDGHRAALDAAGVPVRDELIRPADVDHESGFEAAIVLLHLAPPPTAVFAASDRAAFGAYEAARGRGLRVPDDLSVVGFGDLPEARWASPPLTTVRQPLAEMGLLAARTVLRLAQGERLEAEQAELTTDLQVRDSTARREGG